MIWPRLYGRSIYVQLESKVGPRARTCHRVPLISICHDSCVGLANVALQRKAEPVFASVLYDLRRIAHPVVN